MRPLRLVLENIHSYVGRHELDLSQIRCASVTGSNGSGKTTISGSAPLFALYGATRGNLESIVTRGAQTGRVEFQFAINGSEYLVSRQYTTKGRGKSAVTFQARADDGSWTALATTPADVLRMDETLLRVTAFAMQGESDLFAEARPSERKAVLASILQLDAWEERAQIARARQNDAKSEAQAKGERVDRLLEVANEADALQMAGLDTANLILLVQQELASLESDLSSLLTAREQLVAEQAADVARRASLPDLRARLEGMRPELARVRDRLTNLSTLTNRRGEVEEQIASCLTAQVQAEQMEEARRKREEIGERGRVVDAEIARAKAEHLQQVSLLGMKVQRAQGGEKTRVAEIRGRLQLLEKDAERAKSDWQHQLRQVEGALALCQEAAKPIGDVPCPADLSEKCPALAHARTMRDRIPHWQAEAEALRASEGSWECEDVRAALEAQLAAPDPLPWAADEAALRALQEQEPWAELVAEKGRLAAEYRALGYDLNEHSAAKQIAALLPACQKHLAEIEAAEGQIPDLQANLEAREEEARAIREQTAALESELGPPRNWDVELAANSAHQHEEQKRVAQLRSELSALETQRGELRAKLEASREASEEAERLEGERAKAERRVVVLGALAEACSKRGIPALLIDQALPALEAAANDVLATISDGRMALELRSQRENRDGKLAESLDLVIFQDGAERDYSTYSGGERTRVDLALRAGLSLFLTERAGASCRMLVLDEPPGLDERGQNELCDALGKLSGHFDCILLVTHIERLRDALPTQIRVEKTAEGSRVEVVNA